MRDRILDAAARSRAGRSRPPGIAELARLAGVSRPTVYRHFEDRDAVFRALWEREVHEILDGVALVPRTREELVICVIDVAERFSDDKSLVDTFTSDPALVARYILERLGTSQRLMLDRLIAAIEICQQGRTVRDGVVEELAAMVMLIVQSAVQSRIAMAEFLGPAAWRRELAHALDSYLRPYEKSAG